MPPVPVMSAVFGWDPPCGNPIKGRRRVSGDPGKLSCQEETFRLHKSCPKLLVLATHFKCYHYFAACPKCAFRLLEVCGPCNENLDIWFWYKLSYFEGFCCLLFYFFSSSIWKIFHGREALGKAQPVSQQRSFLS